MVEITSQVAESVLTKIFNETPEEIYKDLVEGEAGKETLKADADSILINRYNEKIVKRHKSEITEKSNQVYNKATKENAEKVISLLKENLGYDADETDLEKAFQIVKEKINSKLKNPLTDDQVKAHKLFVDLEKKALQDIEKINNEWKSKVDSIQSEHQKEKNFARINDPILTKFHELKPVLPTNEMVKKNQIGIFMTHIKNNFDFQFDSNGNADEPLILYAGTDKRYENATGHPITFTEFVKIESAKFFEFQAQGPVGNAGNQGGGSGGTNTYHFKDEADFNQQFYTEVDPQKKIAMSAAWKAQKK